MKHPLTRVSILISFFLFFCSPLKAQYPIPHYNVPVVTNGTIYSAVSDSINTFVAGSMNFIGPPTGGIAKLTPGSNDPDLTYCRPKGRVRAVIADGNGGWFIGGDFLGIVTDSATLVPRYRLAHIFSNGTLDMTWAPAVDNAVYCLWFDGISLYAGGDFTTAGALSRNRVARFSVFGAGAADPLWNPNVSGTRVRCILKDSSGFYLGGTFTQVGGVNRNNIAKVDTGGSGGLNVSWNPNLNGTVTGILSYEDKIIVGGHFNTIGGNAAPYLAKLEKAGAGALYNSWQPQANSIVSALMLNNDKLYVSGSFQMMGGATHYRLARVDAGGTGMASAWAPALNASAAAMILLGGKLYLGGTLDQVNYVQRNYLARVDTSGNGLNALDSVWYPVGNGFVDAMANSGNQILVGGGFTAMGGIEDRKLVKILPGGYMDHNWDPNPGPGYSIWELIIRDSSLYVAGDFNFIDGQLCNFRARLNKNTGHLAPGWVSQGGGNVYCMLVNGANMYLGNNNGLYKFDALTGLIDPNWSSGITGAVTALAISGNDLFVGGSFITVAGVPRNRIAKLDAINAGALDLAWNPDANGTVRNFVISGNELYASGDFTQMGGLTRNRLARLSTLGAGAVDANWNPDADGQVRCMAMHPNGLFIGGFFNNVHGQLHRGIACLKPNGNGAPYLAWNPNPAPNPHELYDMHILGNTLFVAGTFVTAHPQKHYDIAKYNVADMCVPIQTTINADVCQGYTYPFDGQNLGQAGLYVDSASNIDGCDSIVTLNLSVLNNSSDTLVISSCTAYTLNGQTFNTSGTYTQTLINAAGCDSIISLMLTINPLNTGVSQSGGVLTANAAGASYQWISCNPFQILTGETSQVLNATANGDYAVVLDNAICSDTSACFTVAGLFAHDLTQHVFRIYPNPATDHIRIRSEQKSKGSITLKNAPGEIVLHTEADFSSGSATLDVSALPPGVYLMFIQAEGKTFIEKISIVK